MNGSNWFSYPKSKTGFPKRRHKDVTGGRISNVALLSYGSADVFTNSLGLGQSVRELWSFTTSRAAIVAFAALKNKKKEHCLFENDRKILFW